jgi:D-alanyl-D-alanine carboxypeptidase/D-alanyl-D-alanine-endopeptidase (penicillin-binding protein 4)
VALVLVALLAGLPLVRDVPGAAGAGTGPAPAGPVTPVLSARRAPAVLAGPLGEGRLREALAAVADAAPADACLVVTLDGRPVLDRAPDLPLIPASALKVITAAAVLHHLGPDERLRTSVRASAAPAGGAVDDLWLVGGGDPLLGTDGYLSRFQRRPQAATSLEGLADAVAAAGVTRVERVLGDDGRYDAERYVGSWKPGYRATNQTGPLSALTVNDGFAAWSPALVPYPDPPAGAAGTFADLLRGRGVVVGAAGAGRAPAGAVEIAAVASPTTAQLVAQLLTESDNGTSELLLKELGRRAGGEGSTAAGARALEAALVALGHPLDGLRVLDGSGLDREDRLTCRLLHDVLAAAPEDGPLVDGLAVAGRTGTLATRMRGSAAEGRLRAKTGTLDSVASLAGEVTAADGSRLLFAQILNGVTADQGRDLQDLLGAALGSFPDTPALADLGPVGHPPPEPEPEPGAGPGSTPAARAGEGSQP